MEPIAVKISATDKVGTPKLQLDLSGLDNTQFQIIQTIVNHLRDASGKEFSPRSAGHFRKVTGLPYSPKAADDYNYERLDYQLLSYGPLHTNPQDQGNDIKLSFVCKKGDNATTFLKQIQEKGIEIADPVQTNVALRDAVKDLSKMRAPKGARE